MRAAEAQTAGTADAGSGSGVTLPLRFLLRFAEAADELRFVKHCVAFYFRYAQVSLLLGVVLIAGDCLVDRIAHTNGPANLLRLTTAMPVLLVGLGYSLLPKARRHWQPVMAGFIVTVALCLIGILVRIDGEGGAGLKSWVGVLNFTVLQFYCFVILGVQFRHALVSGVAIMAAFLYALWAHAGLSAQQAGYWSYHVATVFILAAGIGWWREFLLRKEFAARAALEDSRAAAEQRALRLAHYDEVTGLPNRRLFAELAAPALERSRRGAARRRRMRRDAYRDRPPRQRQRRLRPWPGRRGAGRHRPAPALLHLRRRPDFCVSFGAGAGRGGAARRPRVWRRRNSRTS